MLGKLCGAICLELAQHGSWTLQVLRHRYAELLLWPSLHARASHKHAFLVACIVKDKSLPSVPTGFHPAIRIHIVEWGDACEG